MALLTRQNTNESTYEVIHDGSQAPVVTEMAIVTRDPGGELGRQVQREVPRDGVQLGLEGSGVVAGEVGERHAPALGQQHVGRA